MPDENYALEDLVRGLDAVMDAGDDRTRCEGVMRVLTGAVQSGADFLSARLQAPAADDYARRLLHRDPQGRYSIVVMVWGPGQGTPLHDHAGTWCVECVYGGSIEVLSYARCANRDSGAGVYDFREEERLRAGVGEAGALIPPFEYHVIRNRDAEPAVTIHVYGGEILTCNTYEPLDDGGFQRIERQLRYTETPEQV